MYSKQQIKQFVISGQMMTGYEKAQQIKHGYRLPSAVMCTMGKMRSKTFGEMYNMDYYPMSAVDTVDFEAKYGRIYVFEKQHERAIRKRFKDISIIQLNIPDIYEYKDPTLMAIIDEKMKGY